MTRKIIDCRAVPNEVGCTLAISGGADEVVAAAAQHAVTVHGHEDTPELYEYLRGALVDEPAALDFAVSPGQPATLMQAERHSQ